ncbi:MAG: tetratricopeptide repeat protein [Kofleriaceae bacterium]|nr:tetratricopeptide repeat protein [Kofleriaceae bacterium]MCL4227749.1 tetratricopeptide repeat protein [Myxococcales bacterium]
MSQVARRYYDRGLTALTSGDVQVAVEQLQAAVELAPAFGNARVAFAVALARFGDCPRAASVLRAGLGRASSPVSAAAMQATLGDVLTLGGDFFGAEEAFRQAGAQPGFEARAASGLARVYARLGRHADAVASLRRAASLARA